jgi:DNA-binding NarL/FixJ family response regulator
MKGGTLLVSREINWFSQFKTCLEEFGFPDVHVTGIEKDGLNMLINELKPEYFLIGSNFYDCATPYMLGQLLGLFPKLNIAVLTSTPFPDAIATWFIFHGIKFYVKLSDGQDEFQYGLQCFLNGKKYIAPDVQRILDSLDENTAVPMRATRRQKEILLMLCCGFSINRIEERLHICKVTVEKHIKELLKIFNSRGREELIKTAYCLDIFSKNELRFYDTGYNNTGLPDWAGMQAIINQFRDRGKQ